jgi:hypothetical protein
MYTQDLQDFKTFLEKNSLVEMVSFFLRLPQGEANRTVARLRALRRGDTLSPSRASGYHTQTLKSFRLLFVPEL